jgi:hypothetical protein
MSRPDLSPQQWTLDFDAPIRNTSLSEAAISKWLKERFDR